MKQYHHKIEEKKQNIMAKLRNRKRIWKKITNEIFQKKKYEKKRELQVRNCYRDLSEGEKGKGKSV